MAKSPQASALIQKNYLAGSNQSHTANGSRAESRQEGGAEGGSGHQHFTVCALVRPRQTISRATSLHVVPEGGAL